MKTMKRLLALLLALTMVLPNCLTIASAYDEEIVEEVVEELEEEIVELPEEVVEDVFEEVYEEEIYEEVIEEEVSEPIAEEEEEAVVSFSSTSDVSAEQAQEEIVTLTYSSDEPLDNEALFAAYANSVFYPEHQPVTLGTAGKSKLSGAALRMYEDVANEIIKVAEGTRADTSFALSREVIAASDAQAILDAVVTALLMDLPYYLYWFDKTTGAGVQFYAIDHKDGTYTCTQLSFTVNIAFASADNQYQVNPAQTGAARNAATYAAQVAESAITGCNTDYEKLLAYANWIRDNVEYNDRAAKGDINGDGIVDENEKMDNYFQEVDGNPWQLIWVFDRDSREDTDVVCEGYAKAFQYLCDLAWPTESVCISVSGTMRYNSQIGAHMWNIVTMRNGKNYLVDVTQYDSNGGLNETFMKGGTGSVANGYTVDAGVDNLVYVYSTKIQNLMGNALALSNSDYYDYTQQTLAAALTAGREVTLYNNLTITGDFQIPANASLLVPEGITLTLAEGAKLTTASGSVLIVAEGAELVVESGAKLLLSDGALYNQGAVTLSGTMDVTGGMVSNEGTVTGSGLITGYAPYDDETNTYNWMGVAPELSYTQQMLLAALKASKTVTLFNDLTITGSFDIPADAALTVADGVTLTVEQGAVLVNNGVFAMANTAALVNHGSMKNHGEMTINQNHRGAGEYIVQMYEQEGQFQICNIAGLNKSEISVSAAIYRSEDPNLSTEAADQAFMKSLGTVLGYSAEYRAVTAVLNGAATIVSDTPIPANATLQIGPGNGNLTVNTGVTMKVYGTIKVTGNGVLTNNGMITTLENGTVTGNVANNPVNGDIQVSTADALMALMAKNAEGAYVLTESAVVIGQISLAGGETYTVPADMTLTVAENAELVVEQNTQLNVLGALAVEGKLTNNWIVEVQSGASAAFAEGSVYVQGQNGMDGQPAEFVLHYENVESLKQVTGLDHGYITLYHNSMGGNADQPVHIGSVITEMANLCKGDSAYRNYIINIFGYTEIIQYTEITENGFVRLRNGGELVIGKGTVLRNNGIFKAFEKVVDGNDVTVEPASVIWNHGILENGPNGIMEIWGDYYHDGELKIYTRLEGNQLTINDIAGVENKFKSIITEITDLMTMDLMTMDQGFAFGDTFGQAQVHMTGTPHLVHGLNLKHNWDLHIYGNAIIDGGVNMEGGQIHVEPGATLTINGPVMAMQGAYINIHNSYDSEKVADGVLTANGPLHIGFNTKPSEDGSWATGVLDVCGVLHANDYVNICEDAHLNVYGTMNQGNVVMDNKGLLNIENGTLNQNHDINNDGQMVVAGTLKNGKGSVWNNRNAVMTLEKNAVVTGFDRYNQIMVYDGAELVNNGAVLDGLETAAASINVRMDDGSSYSENIDNQYIYAVWFPDNTEQLKANIEASVNGTKYGFTEFIPEASFALTEDITIHPNSLLQLWNFDPTETYAVTVPEGITLTTAGDSKTPGQIIINAGTQLMVRGMLNNGGIIRVSSNHRGEETLDPGVLWLAAESCLTGQDGVDTQPGGQLIVGNQKAGEPYLSTYWVHNFGEGSFVNYADGAGRDFRFTPGEYRQVIFYYNEWSEANQSWERTPVDPAALQVDAVLTKRPGKDIDWLANVRPEFKDLLPYFVELGATGGWDSTAYVSYKGCQYSVIIRRDENRGFYASDVITDETANDLWRANFTDSPLSDNHTFYFHFTRNDGFTIRNISLEDAFAEMTAVEGKNNVWKITLEDDYVKTLWNYNRDDRLSVKYTAAIGEEGQEGYHAYEDYADIGIQTIWPEPEYGFGLGTADRPYNGYNYDLETGLWLDSHQDGWSVVTLPNGVSFDPVENVLTLTNANLTGFDTGYQGRDEKTGEVFTNLSKQDLTIKLIGNNTVSNLGDRTGMNFWGGINVTIVDDTEDGTGKLTFTTDNQHHMGAIRLEQGCTLNLVSGTIHLNNADMDWGGVVNLTGATLTGSYSGIKVDQQLNMNGGTIHLTNSSGLSINAMAEIRNAAIDLDNSVMRIMTGTNIYDSTITIDVDAEKTELGKDNFSLWINGYLSIGGEEGKADTSVITINATNFANKQFPVFDENGNPRYDENGEPVTTAFYAVKNTGTFHQMGGTVTVTSDASAALNGEIHNAIPAMLGAGETLLNGGTLTVNGQVGYEQYYDEGWNRPGYQRLEVSGNAVLNANGSDAGIFVNGPVILLGGQVNADAKRVATDSEWPMGVAARNRYIDGRGDMAYLDIEGGIHNFTATDLGSSTGLAKGLSVVSAPIHYMGGTVNLKGEMALHSVTQAENFANFMNPGEMKLSIGQTPAELTSSALTLEENTLWLHTVMNGTAYATDVTISKNTESIVIASQEALDNLVKGMSGNTFATTRNVEITKDVTISGFHFHMRGDAVMTIKSGATVTIQQTGPENTALVARNSAKIIVENGAKIINKGILAVDTGTIQFADADCYEAPANANGKVVGVLRKHYRHGSWGAVTSMDEENPESPVGTELQTVIADISSNDQLWNVTAELNKGYAAGSIHINGDMTIANGTTTLPANTMLFADGGKLTIAESGTLTIGKDAQLTSNTALNLIVNGTLNVNTTNGLWLWGSSVTVGESGTLNVNADLSVTNNTQLNVMGDLVNNAALSVQSSNLNIGRNGKLINNGHLDILESTTDQNTQLNVMGQLVNNPSGVITNNALILVSGALNIDGGEMRQNHTMMIAGSANIRGNLDINGRTVLQSGPDGGAFMQVNRGGRVDLTDFGSRLLVEPGATLRNGTLNDEGYVVENTNGDIRIRMGTLYIHEDGNLEGYWDGIVTRENGLGDESTAPYLAMAWLQEDNGQIAVRPEDGLHRMMRITPNSGHNVVFYENTWYADATNGDYGWQRTPVVPNIPENNLRYEVFAGNNVHLEAGDAWGVDVELTWNKLIFPIHIGKDSDHGFYKAAVASNANWLEDITVNNLSKNPADKVFYFLLTNDYWQMTGNYRLEVPEGVIVNTAYQNDGKTIKVTIPGSTIKTLGHGFWMNMNYDVQSKEGHEENWNFGIQVNCTEVHQLQRDVWMRINGRDYSYNAANGIWMLEGKIVTLPNMSYDYDANTLTMNGADLMELEVSCYGVDEETGGLTENCVSLPNPNLTLVLNGENKVRSIRDSALKISTGVRLNITGDGSLYLLTDNGTGITNEDGTQVWSCSTVHMVNDETLTISGNARVTVEVKGKGVWTDENGQTHNGNVAAVQGASALTVKDNAVLTTVLPDGNRYDDIKGTGGYGGLNEFRNIYIQGGTVNTQYIGTNSYTQTGGTVNIEPLPELRMDDNWQWDEQKQQNVNLGKVSNTNFDGLYTNGGTVTISGGALNITIPNVSITTDRSNYRGIGMDGGKLTINGGVITMDAPAGRMGDGIHLSRNAVFNMNGGRMVMKEDVFANNERPNFLVGEGDAQVNVNGGVWDLDSVNVDLNGETVWNNAVVNGEETIFMAGGPAFIINSGEFNLTGKALTNGYSNALFRAHGMVTMNGGEINIENGVLGVPTGFTLNTGDINIHNDVFENRYGGLYVGNNLAINGGTLTVHTPGGHGIFTENGNTWEEDYPAVYVDGVLHQMGGTVNITNTDDGDFSAAIKSFGNVKLNDGTMNLEGNYGVEIYGNGNYDQSTGTVAEGNSEQTPANTMFFADGGVLNIDARDSGILSRHSAIQFVSIRDERGNVISNPAVNIHSGAGALQLLTNTYDYKIFNNKVYVNEYSFVNTSGSKLVMDNKDLRDNPKYGCWVHTLMDGGNYATNAILKTDLAKTETAFWDELNKLAEGAVYELTSDLTITRSNTLTKPMKVMAGAELVVAPGAVLTLQNNGNLEAHHGGKITVLAGGQINNESAKLTNFMGTITIHHGDEMGYVENEKGQMHMQTYSQNGELLIGTTIGWPNANQTLDVTCATEGEYCKALGLTRSMGFGRTFADMYSSVELESELTIPENVILSYNSPVKLSGGVDNGSSAENTVISTMTVPGTLKLNVYGMLFINNGSVVDVYGQLNNMGGTVIVGQWQNGNFASSGTLNIHGTANLKGYNAVNTFETVKTVNEENQTVYLPGVMNVYGTVNTSPEGESTPGGYFQNFGMLNVENGGKITSNHLFDTIGATNVKSGAAVTLTNGMMVTGTLSVAGALTNEKGTLHVGSFDENGNPVPGTVNVSGTLTNKGIVSVVDKMTVNGKLTSSGGIFLDSAGAKLTAAENATVTNTGIIDPRMGTIDFSQATYVQSTVGYDGITYQGELIMDYVPNSNIFNTTVRAEDMGMVTLRYMGSDLETAKEAKTYAKNHGFRNFIWAINADVTIAAQATVTVAENDYLLVGPGVKLTNNGTIEMERNAAMRVEGTYAAGPDGSVRMELGTASVHGIDTKELTIIKKIQNPATALEELNAALTYESAGYKAMEIHLTAVVENNGDRGLEISNTNVTIDENKELIIGAKGAAKQPVVTISNDVANNGTITNYGDVFVNGNMTGTGTVNNYGLMGAGGSYSGVCGGETGQELSWKLILTSNAKARSITSGTLVISGEGAMTSAPWNDLSGVSVDAVKTILLSTKLTAIKPDAFAKFSAVESVVIPRSVATVVKTDFAEGTTLMVYHNSDAAATLQSTNYIHEVGTDGTCIASGCNYGVTELTSAVTSATTAEAKIDALTQVDTATLKQQMEAEMSGSSTGAVTKAIEEAEQTLKKEKQVTTAIETSAEEIAGDKISFTNAALSVGEDSKKVTLVVSDVDAAEIPKVDKDQISNIESFAAADAVTFDMTLEGVHDPENLQVPVKVTLPIPASVNIDNMLIIHHSVNGSREVIPEINKDERTATIVVEDFCPFEVRSVIIANVEYDGKTTPYSNLAAAVAQAPAGARITVLDAFDGTAEVVADKALTIVTNGKSIMVTTTDNCDMAVSEDKTMINVYPVEAKIGTVKYPTLQEALRHEGAITLLRDVTTETTVFKPVTIYRGGFTADIKAGEGLAVTKTDAAYMIEAAGAQLNGVNYSSFEAALEKAKDGDTITLCQTASGTCEIEKQITVLVGEYGAGMTLNAAAGFVKLDVTGGWKFVKAKAKIGDVYYATLADALQNAAVGSIITMVDHDDEPCHVDRAVTIDKGNFRVNVIVSENLVQNGTAFSQAVAKVGSKGYASLTEAMTAANGGTVTLLQDMEDVQPVNQEVTIITQGKKLDVTTTSDWACIRNNAGYKITRAKAKVVIGENETGYATFDEAVKAASIDSKIVLLDNVGTVTVNRAVTIVPAGYEITANAARYFAVTRNETEIQVVEAEAEIGTVGYATLQAALDADVQGKKTITLLKSLTGDPIQVSQEVTIVKNGKTANLSTTSAYAFTDAPDSYQFVHAVAKIGETGYATLKAALDAVKNATDKKTITLLQNIQEATVIKQEVTIDKNRKTAELSTTSDFAYTVTDESHKFVHAKARIGNTGYETLTDALAAAKEGDTIVLLANETASVTVAKAVTIEKNGFSAVVATMVGYLCEETENAYVIMKKEIVDYKFGQTVQIKLIEPWGLKANARVYTAKESPYIDYAKLHDYGVYFIRASELDKSGLTQDTITIDDIINDTDAIHMTKGNGVEVDKVDNNYVLTAIYDKDLYTYEFSDSVIVLFYIQPDANGERIYAPARERNLKKLVNERKEDTEFDELQRAVYKYMADLEADITNYRNDFAVKPPVEMQKAPTLANYALGDAAESNPYKFGHTVQIKLTEPWGMKLNARVYTADTPRGGNIDYSNLDDYGMVALRNDGTGAPADAAEMLLRKDAYVFSRQNGDATIDTVDGTTVISAIYNKDIFTYQLDTDFYVMFYVKDADGYHYGDVKTRNLHELMGTRKDQTDFKEKERAVYADMIGLFDAVTAYRENWFARHPEEKK